MVLMEPMARMAPTARMERMAQTEPLGLPVAEHPRMPQATA